MPSCLLVDDSRVVRQVARRIVNALGFECREVEDGKMAFEECLRAMPDVILLDWQMPGMNGLDFLVKLRGMPGGNKPKVIFCSLENSPAQIQKALNAGADEYIMKPFDADIIQSKFKLAGIL